jgi:hypothetical protein
MSYCVDIISFIAISLSFVCRFVSVGATAKNV